MPMSTSQSNAVTKLPALLWRRFQYWRAMRIYRRVAAMKIQVERLYAKANRLIGKNVQPPMPLFDRLNNDNQS